MATVVKEKTVEEFASLLQDARGVILAEYAGLNVAAVSSLRRKCRDAGVQYRVIKNTLARRATSQAGMAVLDPLLEGPNAWAIHKTDQVAAAKVLSEFAKDNQKLKIRGGLVDGRLMTIKDVETLAKLPSRDVLLSQTLAAMQSPMSGFAGALNALMRGFATAVDAYAKKRSEAGA
jgi:large subunit ribosomal protein L10